MVDSITQRSINTLALNEFSQRPNVGPISVQMGLNHPQGTGPGVEFFKMDKSYDDSTRISSQGL